MAESFTFEIDKERLGKDLNRLIAKLDDAVRPQMFMDTLNKSGWELAGWSVKNRFAAEAHSKITLPDILTRRIGHLARSIVAGTPEKSGNEYSVKIGTTVEYGPIHEFGGTVNRGTSMRRQFQKVRIKEWTAKPGSMVVTERSRTVKLRKSDIFLGPSSAKYPARPFLRPALENKENQQKVIDLLTENVNKALEKK